MPKRFGGRFRMTKLIREEDEHYAAFEGEALFFWPFFDTFAC